MTEPCSEFVVENVTSEHISRSLRLTLGGPRALGETLRCPELVLAQFWYDLGRSWAPLRGTWGHLGASCVPMLRSWGPLGLPWGVPWLFPRADLCWFPWEIQCFSKGPSTCHLAIVRQLGMHQRRSWARIWCHWRSLWETLGPLGAIWGPSGVLLAAAGGPCCEKVSIFKEIDHFHVPMMSSQGGSRNTDRRFCWDLLQELKVSNDDFEWV